METSVILYLALLCPCGFDFIPTGAIASLCQNRHIFDNTRFCRQPESQPQRGQHYFF